MRRVRVILIAGLLLGTSSMSGAFPPPAYSAKEIRATVVDETTGNPIEGVAVVAQWILERPGSDKPRLHIVETTTGADGKFTIPAWGPKLRVPFTALGNRAPLLLLFKSQYAPLRLPSESAESFAKAFPKVRSMKTRDIVDNIGVDGQPDASVQDSVWNGLAIQLEPFRGTSDQWLGLLEDQMRAIRDEDASRVPGYLRAAGAERAYFTSHPLGERRQYSVLDLFDRIDRLQKKE